MFVGLQYLNTLVYFCISFVYFRVIKIECFAKTNFVNESGIIFWFVTRNYGQNCLSLIFTHIYIQKYDKNISYIEEKVCIECVL